MNPPTGTFCELKAARAALKAARRRWLCHMLKKHSQIKYLALANATGVTSGHFTQLHQGVTPITDKTWAGLQEAFQQLAPA